MLDGVTADPSPASGARVLLVEDDAQLAAMLVELLGTEGYQVERAPDGQRGLHLGLTREFDVMILDRGLPAIEGLDLLGRLRSSGVSAPALVLSALATPRAKVEGLDAGAEDYLGKPFDLDELLARLRALLRRHHAPSGHLVIPGGRLDVDQRTVEADGGRLIVLSGRETALLECLARRPRRVLSRDDLLDLAFPGAEDNGVVDTYVHYLRRKLGKHVIDTVHGVGYRLGAAR